MIQNKNSVVQGVSKKPPLVPLIANVEIQVTYSLESNQLIVVLKVVFLETPCMLYKGQYGSLL